MAGSKSRDKGQRFERAVLKAFRDTFGGEWRRTQDGNSQELSGDVRPLEWDDFPFVVECKTSAVPFLEQALIDKGPMEGWWDQTVRQTPSGLLPLLVCKADRRKTYVVLNHKGLCRINANKYVPPQCPILTFPKWIDDGTAERIYLMTFSWFLQLFEEEEERKKLFKREDWATNLPALAEREALTITN